MATVLKQYPTLNCALFPYKKTTVLALYTALVIQKVSTTPPLYLLTWRIERKKKVSSKPLLLIMVNFPFTVTWMYTAARCQKDLAMVTALSRAHVQEIPLHHASLDSTQYATLFHVMFFFMDLLSVLLIFQWKGERGRMSGGRRDGVEGGGRERKRLSEKELCNV